MPHDIRTFELMTGLRQDAGAVERDIAVADNRGVSAAERGVEVGEVRMAIVPADELRRADDSGQLFARNAELAVVRSADRKDHRIIEIQQLCYGNISPDGDIADEVHAGTVRDLVVALARRPSATDGPARRRNG